MRCAGLHFSEYVNIAWRALRFPDDPPLGRAPSQMGAVAAKKLEMGRPVSGLMCGYEFWPEMLIDGRD